MSQANHPKSRREIIKNRVKEILERKRQKEPSKRKTNKVSKQIDMERVRGPWNGEEYFTKDGKYYNVHTKNLVAWTKPDGVVILRPNSNSKRKELNWMKATKPAKATTKATKVKTAKATKVIAAKPPELMIRPVYEGDVSKLKKVVGPWDGWPYYKKDGRYYHDITLELVAWTKPNGKIVRVY